MHVCLDHIPEISASALAARAEAIVPLTKVGHRLHYVTNATDLHSSDFYNRPEIGAEVTEKLDTVLYAHDFMTRHKVVSETEFAPTPAEILAQMPDEILKRACAYAVDGKIRHTDGINTLYWTGMVYVYGKPRIPHISDEELHTRAGRIKALVRDDKGVLHHIVQPKDLRHTAYLWDPKLTEPAGPMKEVGYITTYHTWAYYGYFKPDIGEVLAQIPDGLLDRVVAFELTKSPEDSEDLNQNLQELNEGYHVAQVTLYGAA